MNWAINHWCLFVCVTLKSCGHTLEVGSPNSALCFGLVNAIVSCWQRNLWSLWVVWMFLLFKAIFSIGWPVLIFIPDIRAGGFRFSLGVVWLDLPSLQWRRHCLSKSSIMHSFSNSVIPWWFASTNPRIKFFYSLTHSSIFAALIVQCIQLLLDREQSKRLCSTPVNCAAAYFCSHKSAVHREWFLQTIPFAELSINTSPHLEVIKIIVGQLGCVGVIWPV